MPGTRVRPARSGPMVEEHGREASVLYAGTRSAWAAAACTSAECCVPMFVHGAGKPTIAAPGLTPMSPVLVEAPVHVTVDPARTAKGLRFPPRKAWASAGEASYNSAAIPITPETANCLQLIPNLPYAA